MTEPLLEGRNLRKAFGGLIAVDDVSLQITPGTAHSIIGPNGAGKTTLFNLLSGRYRPTSGTVWFKGRNITRLPVYERAHIGMGRSFQITNLFPQLSVLENVRLAVQAKGSDSFRLLRRVDRFTDAIEKALEVLELVGLRESAQLPASVLPHGGKRKLELAILLAGDPEILLLDEPTAGMASEQVPELMTTIDRVRRDGGRTVVLVEHNMNVVMSISDRITVMHMGRLLAEGTPTEIAANAQVQDVYLGQLYDLPTDGAAHS